MPQRVKGQDYDVEVEYPGGVIACAEAKCNIESTTFGESTIRNKLDGARQQLPPDQPGTVFVKMPPKWMDESGFKMTIGVAQSFLKGTRRIVSLKFYVSPNSIEGGYMKQQHSYKEISNPNTRFGAAKNWDLFHKMDLPPEYMACLRIGSACCFSLTVRCGRDGRAPRSSTRCFRRLGTVTTCPAGRLREGSIFVLVDI